MASIKSTSHLLPTPVTWTPAADEKNQIRIKSSQVKVCNTVLVIIKLTKFAVALRFL